MTELQNLKKRPKRAVKKEVKKKVKGFVALLFCFSLPLLMAVFLFFFATSLLLKLRMQAQHLCRSHGLRTQEAILKNLKKLFKLNPKSCSVREQEKTASNTACPF